MGRVYILIFGMFPIFVALYLYGAFLNSSSEEVVNSLLLILLSIALTVIFAVMTVISLSLDIRRAHDIGANWQLVLFAICLGIPYLYIALKPGGIGQNRYGMSPTRRGSFSMIFNSDEKKRLDMQPIDGESVIESAIFRFIGESYSATQRAIKNGFVTMTAFQKTQTVILLVIAIAVVSILAIYLAQVL